MDGSGSSKCQRKDSANNDSLKKRKNWKDLGSGNCSQVSSLNSPSNSKKISECVIWASPAVAHLSHSMEEKLNGTRAMSLWPKQKLDEATSAVVQSHSAEIQQAKTHLHVWQVECQVSWDVGSHQAKAFDALIAKCNLAKPHPADEEEYHEAIIELIETIMTEGSKIPGGQGISFTSNPLKLVPTLHMSPVMMSGLDLPHEADYKILIPEPARENREPRSMVNLTNLTMPRSSPQICTSSLNTNIRLVTPLHVGPMHPSDLFKTGGVSAPPPPQGWDYGVLKSHSTPVPFVKGKSTGISCPHPQVMWKMMRSRQY